MKLNTRLPSLQALAIPYRYAPPRTSAARTGRRTAVKNDGGLEEVEFYWDSSGREWAPPNFPNHTNALLFGEYGKKKPTRMSGRAAPCSGKIDHDGAVRRSPGARTDRRVEWASGKNTRPIGGGLVVCVLSRLGVLPAH